MSIASDLKGCVCECVFDLPHHEWPIPGYPAWVVVEDADMGMVKMRSKFGSASLWVSASKIKKIRAVYSPSEIGAFGLEPGDFR